MRVLIAPFGSRGDVQPMLALALALTWRRHEVTVCAPPDYARWVSQLGFRGHSVGPSMKEFVQQSMQPGLEGPRYAMRELPRMIAGQFGELERFVDGCDVMLGSTLTAAGASFAEKLGFRYHYVSFSPAAIPSAWHPSLFTQRQDLPRWVNRLTWWQSAFANNWGLRGVINAQRKRLGLRPIRDAWRHLVDQRLILASDPALAPVPSDARYACTQTGAWFLPETDELSPELEAFLAAGEPPVYVGFGSMPNPEVSVLEQLEGRRAIVSGVPLSSTPSRLVVGSTPHGKLFPRCAAVIHHGGAGTTVTAARAGVPQLVVPHATDQFFWKRRLEERGLAPASGRLTDALALKENAQAFAPKIAVDGLERAIAEIEARS